MANNLGPSPTHTIHEKLANERRWQFGQTHQGKIDKLVSRQIFYIELTTNIHKIIDNPEMVNSIFEIFSFELLRKSNDVEVNSCKIKTKESQICP